MIKAVFIYRTKTEYLSELEKKLMMSRDPKFNSEIKNLGINLFKREDGQYTFILLDIYYYSVEDYKIRTEFEHSQKDWVDIWFNPANRHETISVEIYDVLNKSF